MVREFIEGWDLVQILGEGTFAEVKLLVNRETGDACAVKEVDLSLAKNSPESDVRKEAKIHKLLKHRNIVQCYGSRVQDDRYYIFLEYCSGGELFDRIEPEKGMPEFQAQGYFKQLIAGVEYLHRRGIVHRDIKPENILLTENDVLKISDFGLATVFRHEGKERLLERHCGTRAYMAPEMLLKPKYNAEPVDIWSCGIVLVAMLAGVLPWNQPTPEQREFQVWKAQEYEKGPWKQIDSLPLSLLRKILTQHPSKRYTVTQIRNHLWVKKRFKDADGKLLLPHVISPPLKRVKPVSAASGIGGEPQSKASPATAAAPPEDTSAEAVAPAVESSEAEDTKKPSSSDKRGCFYNEIPVSADRYCASQPANLKEKFQPEQQEEDDDAKENGNAEANKISSSPPNNSTEMSSEAIKSIRGGKFTAFSQPVCARDMFCSTQSGTQTQGSQSQFQRLVKRMTRFWISTQKTEDATAYLKGILEQLGYSTKYPTRGIIKCETTDRRGGVLIFIVTIIECDAKILVDMRLSRGCGMDFKKHFAKVKKNLAPIIEKTPIMFPSALPIESLPGVPE